MNRIFYPNSIVIIGVSEKPDNLARNIIANLKAFHYRGRIYAVGRQAGEVYGVPIVASLDEVPDRLDLAVILTPAFLVPDLVAACGRKGILRVVIESGGFGEFSPEGRALEERLVDVARRHGIRFVGPNCISVINLENGVCLPFAPLSPADAKLGPASVIAQSGGVSVTYVHRLSLAGVGANKGVSIGNKIDLDEIDYLAYLLDDPGTEMVFLYLESISNGRRLMELAASSAKPVVVQKANRGKASQSVAFSHTAALADDDRIVSAAFRQAGILRAESFRDVVAIAQGLTLPPVKGSDLVVISRSGGHAVVAADAAERLGFSLPPLPERFVEAVRGFFRADVIAPTNPLDLGVIFDFDLYARIVEHTLQALRPHAILLINTYGPSENEGARRLAHRVQEITAETGRPIAFCAYARGEERERLQAELKMPVFTEIEEALRALAASRERNAWLTSRRAGPVAAPEGAPLTLPAAGVLPADRALEVCAACGIPTAAWQRAGDAASARQAADLLGLPVALKVLAADLTHKSDAGGVVLNLARPDEVEEAAGQMLARWNRQGIPAALMVQRMAGPGVEVILGGRQDRTFGPVVIFGLGGIHVEVFDDVAFRVAPLTRHDAEQMIDEVRGHRLLLGGRGRPPSERTALIEAILAVSRLMRDHPELIEFEINPLLATADGVLALDARGMVGG